MKKSICILSLIYVGLLANVSYVLAENETASAEVKKSCTIELRKDSKGAYFFQASTIDDAAKIYIRRGNKSNDPQTYLYTDCDTIYFADSTGVKLPDNKYYLLVGLDQNKNSISVEAKNGNTITHENTNNHNINNTRKDYIVFKNKLAGAEGLSIDSCSEGNKKLSFILRSMRLKADSIPVNIAKVEYVVSRQRGKDRKDTTLVISVRETRLVHMGKECDVMRINSDTLRLRKTDSIKCIRILREKEDIMVFDQLDTTKFISKIHISQDHKLVNADDVAFKSTIELSPKAGFSSLDHIILKGHVLCKEGVLPCQFEIFVEEEEVSIDWLFVLLIVACVLGVLLIVLVVGGIIKVIKSKKSNHKQPTNEKDKEKHPVESPEPKEPVDPKEVKISELSEQVKKLDSNKSNLEKELSSANANLQSAQATIAAKNGEIKKLNSDIANLNQQLNDAEAVKNKALSDQKEQLEELFEKDKKEFETQIQQLKTDNEALSSKVNIGRDELFEQFNKRLEEAKKALADFSNALIQIPGEDDIYSSTMQNILNDFDLMYSDIANIDANNLDIDKLRKELQQLSKRHLSPAGWMNKIAILTSYSKVEAVNKEFAQRGIHSVALEKLSALINVLLGTIDISLIVPTVLLSKFDSKQYKSTNEEAWIDKYCSEISIYNYSGVVIDIVQVGYSIADKDMQNPIVLYN